MAESRKPLEVLTLVDTLAMPNLTLVLPATLLAGGTSWLLNGKIRTASGNQGKGLVFLTPLIEEAAKSLWAVTLGASLVWTHLGFGLLEGALEIKRRGSRGIAAGWVALAAHSLFGIITYSVIRSWGLFPALAVAYLSHAAWNRVVIYYSDRQGTA